MRVYPSPKESQEKKGRIEKIIVMILKNGNYDFIKLKLGFFISLLKGLGFLPVRCFFMEANKRILY
ncbi:hypothetical protein BSK20_04240 [SR1 bacterium human oral taxon HOT-345]|nr:hypothetical protein BSK20_04240 [SR1 bacterium human oral taxon HOT-345]